MIINVRLFAALHEVVGREEIEVDLGSGKTAGELLDLLVAEHPKLDRYRDVVQIAVNQDFVDRDTPITADDEVALLPPVSGG
jgi:molybdopterin converting factor subunit 1